MQQPRQDTVGRSANRYASAEMPVGSRASPPAFGLTSRQRDAGHPFGPDYCGKRVEAGRAILDVTRYGVQYTLAGLLGLGALAALLLPLRAPGPAFLAAILGGCAYMAGRSRAEIEVDQTNGIIRGYTGTPGTRTLRLTAPTQGNLLVTMSPWFQRSDEGSDETYSGMIFQLAIGTPGARTLLFTSAQRDQVEAVALAIAEATDLPVFRRGYRVITVEGREEVVDPRMEVGLDPGKELGEPLPAPPSSADAAPEAAAAGMGEARRGP